MALIENVEADWAQVLLVSRASVVTCTFTVASEQEFFLNAAARRFRRIEYGDCTAEIQAYAAAHFAQMAGTEAAGEGPPSSETIGGVSIGRTLPVNNTDETWGETIYGRAVKKLMRSKAPTMLVVNPGPC